VLIVLAYDLSPSAARAGALIAHATWPAGTTIVIVTSPAAIDRGLASFAGLQEARTHDRERRATIASAQDDLAREFTAAGMSVQTAVARGRPASAIVTAAHDLGADLVVGGARRQGALAATLLGSVSAEIIERAPCSVLIARGTSFARVLLATDGSPTATHATELMAGWPLFEHVRIRVMGVDADASPSVETVLTAAEGTAADGLTGPRMASEAGVAVLEATRVLARTHPDVDTQIRGGDPGSEIVAAAKEWAADLVVLGSDRAPSRRGLLLGSVARQVLHGIDASALIVRSPGRASPGR
jgi:nucleotide-binding universal stress UspA family protein